MSGTSNLPVTQCCTENLGEGCGVDYPGKTAEGLCQKCKLLDTLDENSTQYQQAKGYPQCLTCGVAWKHLPHTDKCGPCHQKALNAAGLVNHSVDTAIQARSNAFNIRTHRASKPNSLTNIPANPTIPLNTAALDQFRNVGFNDADCVKVYAEARIGKTIDDDLGKTSRPYAPDTPMTDVINDLVKIWNVTWVRSHAFPLDVGAAELRFHGNQTIIENTDYLPVLDFYQMHKSAANHESYFNKLPKHAASMKGKVLALEIRWNSKNAAEPSPKPSSSASVSNIKKRKNGKEKENEEQAPKRPRVSGSLESTFIRALPGPDPTKSTEINIFRADIFVDPDSCEARAVWPAGPRTLERAAISDEIYQSGKMKHCYKLSIGNIQYVAKRFYEIGKGAGEVTLQENMLNLVSDATRCEMARWVLKKFRQRAAEVNLPVAQNFEITEILIVEEVVEDGGAPSPASGVTSEILESESESGGKIVWMLEPLRNTAVTHYTGTMQHPAGTGQLAQTLSAFVHFAYQESGGNIVFADVQGSPGRLTTKTMGMIIFDLMTHTENGDSGVGDHGVDNANADSNVS